MALAAEAEEQAAAAQQAGAAEPVAREVYGKPANQVQQLVAGQVAAVRAEGEERAQVGLVVEAETALAAEAPVVGVAARDLAVEAELEEAEELVVAPVRPANRASGWPRQQCSREACWAEFQV